MLILPCEDPSCLNSIKPGYGVLVIKGDNQTKAVCARCGKYIKFISKPEKNLVEPHQIKEVLDL